MKKSVAAISLSAALLGGGAVGVALGLPSTSGAATPDTTAVTAAPSDTASTPTTAAPAAGAPAAGAPAADATDPAAGAATSNEDPTHEGGESTTREADEAAGKVGGGHGDHLGGGSNEDPTHETNESAARESDEDAAKAAQATPATPTTPPTTPSTTVAPSNA
jgi:hypothetical protein